MKTLNTIQKLSKAGKIISKIIFIFCIVGFVGSAIGIISLAIIPEGIQLDGMTINAFIEKNAEVSLGTCYAVMAASMIICVGEAVLCKLAEIYFKNELDAGTPFTFEGAKEMMRLGIFAIVIPIVTNVIAGVVYSVMKLVMKDVADYDFSAFSSIGVGIMFIIVGLICRHGAEISEEKKQNEQIEEQ